MRAFFLTCCLATSGVVAGGEASAAASAAWGKTRNEVHAPVARQSKRKAADQRHLPDGRSVNGPSSAAAKKSAMHPANARHGKQRRF